MSDKDTKKHRTRQLVELTTVVPDSDNLIRAIYISHEIVKKHCGVDIAKHITDVLPISPEQYQGGSYDGQYFDLGVPGLIAKHFGVDEADVQDDHDALHRIGLLDKKVRKDGPKVDWATKMTDIVSSVFNLVNYGKQYELFLEVCNNLELEMADPMFFSNTRFPNYGYRVFSTFLKDLPGLIATLATIKMENYASRESRKREQADVAARLLGQITSQKFLIQLCGTVDIYQQIGLLSEVLQVVDSLPHQRLDKFIEFVRLLEKMSNSLFDHTSCSGINSMTYKLLFWCDLFKIFFRKM